MAKFTYGDRVTVRDRDAAEASVISVDENTPGQVLYGIKIGTPEEIETLPESAVLWVVEGELDAAPAAPAG